MNSENNGQNKKQTFAEKHPRINTLIGWLALIALCVAIFFCLRWVIRKIKALLGIVSKWDIVLIVALVTGVITLVTSIISKIIDYRKSQREYLAQKREQPYEDFVELVYQIQVNSGKEISKEEIIKDVSKINKQLTLWGSPRVVNKWSQFREVALQGTNNPNMLFILEEIMNEMRADMGTKKVKKGNLLSFFVGDIKQVIKQNKK